MQDPTHSSPPLPPASPISQVTAHKKLRKLQDKIYQARHRIDILNNKISRVQIDNMNKTRISGFKGSIRDFANTKYSIKKEFLMRRSVEIDACHQNNLEKRVCHKERVSEMRQMIATQNRWVCENIRRQREINQKSVQQQRNREYHRKRERRNQMVEQQQQRTAYLQEYLKHKHLSAKLSKEEDTSAIQAKIIQRQKILAKLERQGSQLSVNPELTARSRSNDGSESRLSRALRYSQIKSKTRKLEKEVQ